MKQIFVSGPIETSMTISLDDATAHHIFDVLRTQGQERIRIASGSRLFLGRTLTKPFVEVLEEVDTKPAAKAEITLCAALIKADKFEWMLQKAAELGVSRIVPFTSERTVVTIEAKKEERKRQRWLSILEGACRQSNRTTLVELEPVCRLRDLPKYKSEISLCAWEKEDGSKILAQHLARPFSSVTYIIGPEGGLSSGEAAFLEEEGYALVSLGDNILRAETAACFVLSATDYQLQANALMQDQQDGSLESQN